MKDFRPQVLIGILILGVLAWVAMQLDFEPLAGVFGGGIVAAVTTLTKDSNTP